MSATDSVNDVKRELARRINQDARSNPQSPYANKFVGIANGQVVVVADDWNEMAQQLRQAEPDVSRCFALEASRDLTRSTKSGAWTGATRRMAAPAWPALCGGCSQAGLRRSTVSANAACRYGRLDAVGGYCLPCLNERIDAP